MTSEAECYIISVPWLWVGYGHKRAWTSTLFRVTLWANSYFVFFLLLLDFFSCPAARNRTFGEAITSSLVMVCVVSLCVLLCVKRGEGLSLLGFMETMNEQD